MVWGWYHSAARHTCPQKPLQATKMQSLPKCKETQGGGANMPIQR